MFPNRIKSCATLFFFFPLKTDSIGLNTTGQGKELKEERD